MIDVLGPVRDRLGESPLWSVVDQALWWVDIEGRALRRYDWTSRTIATWDTAERPGSIALHARGGLLAAMESGLFHLRPQADGELDAQRVASVVHARADMRFNPALKTFTQERGESAASRHLRLRFERRQP